MDKVPKGFKAIPDFPGYFINKTGEVWSGPNTYYPTGRILKSFRNGKCKHRYLFLSANSKKFKKFIHRLVLEVFIGPCPEGMECCHRNDIADDNNLENLYWGTRSENIVDAFKNGGRRKKLSAYQIQLVRWFLLCGNFSHREIGAFFKVSGTTISNIRREIL